MIRRRFFTHLSAALAGICAACAGAAFAQDSLRIGIHELQAAEHRWDDLRLDRRVPAFERGKRHAVAQQWDRAEAEFRSGIRLRPAPAWFNLGLLEFHRGRFDRARTMFHRSWKIDRDSTTKSYVRNTERLIQERKAHR